MTDAVQRRLLDRLRPDLSHTGEVLRVLATTHDLDAQFFDSDFLCTVLSISQSEYAGAAGQLALQRKLAALEYSGVLCEAAAFERRPNLRTAVYPVGLRGARLHAKLLVVEYEHAVRLLVGSANLTEPGYRSNREVAGEHLAERRNPARAAEGAAILRGALQSLEVFQERGAEFLSELRQVTVRLEEWARGASAASPVVWSDSGHPLHRSLLARWPEGSKVERLRLVSPFWCEDGSKDTPLRRLLSALAERGALAERCAVELYVESAPLSGGGAAPKEPLCFFYRDFPGVSVRVLPVSSAVDPAELEVKIELTAARRLHAKVVVLESAEHALAYAGSANFTRRGFGLRKAAADGSTAANIEAGWVFELPLRAVPGVLPPAANGGALVPSLTEPGAPLASDEDEEARFWPSALLSVEVGHSGEGDALTLTARFDATAPAGWLVSVPSELEPDAANELLFTTSGGAQVHQAALSLRVFRALLRERHVVVTAAEGQAYFPVNIAAGEARHRLPLATGGALPSESDLLDYYLGRLQFEDLFTGADATEAGAAEGNERGESVDKSRIQAYQLRAFVDALAGIRNELRSLSGSRGVLYQGFLGPVSPVALARGVVQRVNEGTRSPLAGAFQLVELATLLDSLVPHGAASEHYAEFRTRAREEIQSLLEELRAQHRAELSAESGFGRYEARMQKERCA